MLPYYAKRSIVIFFVVSTLFQACLADECKEKCNLDCGALRKCEIHSIDVWGYGFDAACECKPDTGKLAGVVIGALVGLIAIPIAICWCCKCCCFTTKSEKVIVVQAPQVPVAQA
jgi:hypothetical protein